MDAVRNELFSDCDLDSIFAGGSWKAPSSAERIETATGECGTKGLRAQLEPKTIVLSEVPRHDRA